MVNLLVNLIENFSNFQYIHLLIMAFLTFGSTNFFNGNAFGTIDFAAF